MAALLTVLFPPVQKWLAENPVEFVAALAAVNVVVRFLTSGKVSISGGLSGGAGCWLCLGAAVGFCMGLPSCSTLAPPFKATIMGPGYSASYSEAGVEVVAVLPSK